MRYKILGKSGLKVSELCLGTMTFGEEWGWGASKAESRRMFDAFIAAGGNFIDTANRYTNGTSETYLGEFMAPERDKYVLATKYTLNGRPSDPNAGGNHRKNLIQSIDASLKRLKTDYIDLYWVHAWDGITPLEEMMRALDDQVRAGKILYIGFSDAPAWVVSRANTMAELMGWSTFIAMQMEYSLIERGAERELIPMAEALNIGFTAWSPLAGGVLTGKYNSEKEEPRRYTAKHPHTEKFVTERNLNIAGKVVDIARRSGRTPSQVALSWMIDKSGRVPIIPIIGGRSEAQIRDNMGCLDFKLRAEDMAELDKASAITLGFPNDFLNLPYFHELVHGKTFDQLDARRC